MLEPIMFSAITTGPDTPNTLPYWLSRWSSRMWRTSRFALLMAPAIVWEVREARLEPAHEAGPALRTC